MAQCFAPAGNYNQTNSCNQVCSTGWLRLSQQAADDCTSGWQLNMLLLILYHLKNTCHAIQQSILSNLFVSNSLTLFYFLA
jgi:hypothetical protein